MWAHLLSCIQRDGETQLSWGRCIPHVLSKCFNMRWIVLGKFLSLHSIERTKISDAGSMNAITHTTFQRRELILDECGPHAQLFQRMNPLLTQMETDEHILPSSVLTAPLFLPLLCLLPNSMLRPDKLKLKDQDCKSLSFNFAVWFQLQTGCIWDEKR